MRTYKEKCAAILIWSEDRENFDESMVDNIYTQIDQGRELSMKQKIAIDNIIDSYRIDVEAYLD